jgi:8-oxo-dGTP diphosphatase
MPFVYAVAFSGEEFVMVRNRLRGWEMPGGEVEAGESPEEAVNREFVEETGMRFKSIASVPIPSGTVFFGIAEKCDESFSCGCSDCGIGTSDEIEEVAFFTRLPENLSFPREEYETMLQEGKIAVKKYIN